LTIILIAIAVFISMQVVYGQNASLQKKMKKLKERIDKEKDKDIQAELQKGNIVEIIDSASHY
jgi:hypothetical protein